MKERERFLDTHYGSENRTKKSDSEVEFCGLGVGSQKLGGLDRRSAYPKAMDLNLSEAKSFS